MEYLHSMVRVKNLEESLDFYCNKLGLVEARRYDNEGGRFTLVFLAAAGDIKKSDDAFKSPLVELTYNWPDENGEIENYSDGRNFGHLAYRVENIYETCQQLMNKGVTINRPPRDGYMAFVKSPDGVSIELLQGGERLTPQEPWSSMENTGSW
jgi:lactoylglutathione lyase